MDGLIYFIRSFRPTWLASFSRRVKRLNPWPLPDKAFATSPELPRRTRYSWLNNNSSSMRCWPVWTLLSNVVLAESAGNTKRFISKKIPTKQAPAPTMSFSRRASLMLIFFTCAPSLSQNEFDSSCCRVGLRQSTRFSNSLMLPIRS